MELIKGTILNGGGCKVRLTLNNVSSDSQQYETLADNLGAFSAQVALTITDPIALLVDIFKDESLKLSQSFDYPLTKELEFSLVNELVEYPAPEQVYKPKYKRLRGNLLPLDDAKVGSKRVLLIGQQPDAGDLILLNLLTDKWGNFYGDLPTGYAPYKLGLADTQTAVFSDKVQAGDEKTTGMPEEPVYFNFDLDALDERTVLTVPVVATGITVKAGDKDCACDTPKVNGLPDAEELVGTYQQQIGGGCVNFTEPNRALEEFSYYSVVRINDPEVVQLTLTQLDGSENEPVNPIDTPAQWSSANPPKVLVGDEEEAQSSDDRAVAQETPVLPLYGNNSQVRENRYVPGKQNRVDWDNTPTILQAVTISYGHLLHFKQVWKADGYSLGDLLHSLPLAPGQKKQIAIFDWDREESNSRAEELRYDEAIDAHLTHNRDINEITSAALNERNQGSSSANTSGRSGGFGVAAGGFAPGVFLGVAGGAAWSSGSSSSTALSQASRNASSSALQSLRDRVMQGASAVRNQRATVVQTVRQGERVQAQTEVVANYNHCHAITIQHFEVLRHLAVENKLAGVSRCFFIPMPITIFTAAKVMRWKEILKPMVESYANLNKHEGNVKDLPRGFDAIERVYNEYQGVSFPQGTYANADITDIWGNMQLAVQLSRPADVKVPPTVPTAGTPDFYEFIRSFQNIDRYIRDNTVYELDANLWQPYLVGSGMSLGDVEELFAGKSQAERNLIFQQVIAPQIVKRFANDIDIMAVDQAGNESPLPFDISLLNDPSASTQGRLKWGKIATGNAQVLNLAISLDQALTGIKRSGIKAIKVKTNTDFGGMYNSSASVSYLNLQYSNAYMTETLCNKRSMNDLSAGDHALFFTPTSARENVNPTLEDQRLLRQLLQHLNARLETYHRAIWMEMDTERRFMLLDGLYLDYPVGSGQQVQSRSVASLVENRLLGIVGNSLVMPAATGVLFPGEPARELMDYYGLAEQPAPFRISVPTRGVFAEAVMGACNSCEMIDDRRFWKWEEHPLPDDPTGINPLSMDSRYQLPPDLRPTSMPNPIVNIQNAPNAPDFQGANALVSMLSNPNLFKDLSGLDANQANALQALLSAASSAQGYAGMASNLANTSAGLLSQQMSQDYAKDMQKSKYVQDNYQKLKDNLDAQLGNGQINDVEYARRLGQLNDALIGTSGQQQNPAVSQGNNQLPAPLRGVQDLFHGFTPEVAQALAQNPDIASAIAQLLGGGNFSLDDLTGLLAQFAGTSNGQNV
jgi:hypothetical protein